VVALEEEDFEVGATIPYQQDRRGEDGCGRRT
jgi:hypothetical protein